MRRHKFHEKALQFRRPVKRDKKNTQELEPLFSAYRILLDRFGYQGWWPTTEIRRQKPEGRRQQIRERIQVSMVPVYHPGRKSELSESEEFEICVGAILTQNTSWKNVEKAIECLNKNRMMNPQKIAASSLPSLSCLIKSSGFFKQKAVKLKRFSEYLLKKHPEGISEWFKNSKTEDLRNELLAMYGIGPETADSVILYAAGKPKFVIDAYTLRIFKRTGFFNKIDYHQAQKCFEENLPQDVPVYQEYHALLVKLGKDFCRKKNPLCGECPLGVDYANVSCVGRTPEKVLCKKIL